MPDISKIKLPSGTTYDIKDAVARQMISAGVTFIVAWNGTSAPVAANIPEGVIVTYNNTNTTGTLAASDAVAGAFYLVKSKTSPTSETLDIYDEYVVVKPITDDTATWFWEKVGDTQLNLADVVTNVTLNPQTHTVIGTDATFTITQPTITLATDTISGTGKVQVATDVTATNTNLKATASGAKTAWNSKDTVTAVTGYENTSTDTFIKSISPTSQKLVTTSITGVNGSVKASKASKATSQTTTNGQGTSSTTNTDWLKGVSVSEETLTIGAATFNTQQTTQFTFADVDVPKAASATTVATGAVAASDTNGASIVTTVATGDTADALTALGTPTTKSAIGTNSTFTITQPTIALATGATAGTGVVSVATDVNVTTGYIGATASGANTAWNSQDSVTVLKSNTTLNVEKHV